MLYMLHVSRKMYTTVDKTWKKCQRFAPGRKFGIKSYIFQIHFFRACALDSSLCYKTSRRQGRLQTSRFQISKGLSTLMHFFIRFGCHRNRIDRPTSTLILIRYLSVFALAPFQVRFLILVENLAKKVDFFLRDFRFLSILYPYTSRKS